MLRKVIIFQALLMLTYNIPALGADQLSPISQQGQSDTSDSTTNSGKPLVPLSGGVQKVELDLEKLRNIGLDLKQVLKAASSLYDEVTIQPVRILTQPEVVGRGTFINIPVGTQPTGPPQPARKERVDMAIHHMKPVVDVLKKDADEFIAGEKQLDLPQDISDELKPQFQDWINIVNSLALSENELEQLAEAPPYDNKAIARITTSIQEDVKNLDKTRLKIYKVIRKEGKRIANKK